MNLMGIITAGGRESHGQQVIANDLSICANIDPHELVFENDSTGSSTEKDLCEDSCQTSPKWLTGDSPQNIR
jgi:hypothetical protein